MKSVIKHIVLRGLLASLACLMCSASLVLGNVTAFFNAFDYARRLMYAEF